MSTIYDKQSKYNSRPKPRGRNLPIPDLAEAICQETAFARDSGGLLYVFESGVYKPSGISYVARKVKEICRAWGYEGLWTPALAESVSKYIAADLACLWDAPPDNLLNLNNGILDVNTLDLELHTSDYLSTIQLSVSYDAGATCPRWDKFIQGSLPEDCQKIVWEILAWLMTANTDIQKVIFLTGPGGNGRSTLIAALTAFLGASNVENMSVQSLTNDRFAPANLYGRLANFCADIPSTRLMNTGMLKQLTGGDRVQIERKYLSSFPYRPFAKLLFSGNELPAADDATEAYTRRVYVLPMERQWHGTKGEIPRAALDAMLSNPTELSGVLNRALDALPKIRAHGLSIPDSVRVATDEHLRAGNPLADWIDERLDISPDRYVEKALLIAVYNKCCQHAKRQPVTKQAFGRAVHRLIPGIGDSQKTIGGRLKDVYVGAGLKRIKIFNRLSFNPPLDFSSGDSAVISHN